MAACLCRNQGLVVLGERLGELPLLGYKSSMAGLAPQSTQGEGGRGGQGKGGKGAQGLGPWPQGLS